jgi:galactokinase
MTGAGFGGCTVNLVTEDAVDPMIEQVEKAYRERTGLNADFYIAEISDGVRKVIS